MKHLIVFQLLLICLFSVIQYITELHINYDLRGEFSYFYAFIIIQWIWQQSHNII
jgi:hypothetical protein